MRRIPLIVLGALLFAGLIGSVTWVITRDHAADATREESSQAGEGFSNIFVADLASHRLLRLTQNDEEDLFATEPSWAPDGSSLIYAQVPCDDCAPVIEVVPTSAEGGRPRRLMKGSHPSFFPDGKRFVFLGPNGGLYVGRTDGRVVRELFSPRDTWSQPTVSPDGSKVLAVLQRADGHTRLAVASLNEPGEHSVLPSTGRSTVDPVWAPDGRHISFAALGAGGAWHLYSASSDGSERRMLFAGGSDTEPAWSPDGTEIAFVRTTGGKSLLFTARSDGSNVRRLFGRDMTGARPRWSPDGTRIAFTAKGE